MGNLRQPSDLMIRAAQEFDAPGLSLLLADLGYPATVEETVRQLAAVASAPGTVLVAESGNELAGLVAVTWQPMLHLAHPLARLTTLVIAGKFRRTGIGRLLLDHASEQARAAGCEQIEVTTSIKREGSREFYLSQGFILGSHRLHKPL